jgi:S1-C subfamily serine protease
MHEDPQLDAATDGSVTERHTVPPAGQPAAPDEWAAVDQPASPDQPVGALPPSDDPAVPVDRYTPASEPRPDWTRDLGGETVATPERWYEPAPTTEPVVPVTTTRRSRGGMGTVVGAALLSAVLASGGTVLALGASGALDRPVTTVPASTSQGTNVAAPQPVAIDESSATINVAAKVNPAVVRITVTGASGAGDLGVIPATGVGSGVIFNSAGWILTNHHVVEGGTKFDVQLYDGRVLSGSVYGIDTLTDLAIVKVDGTNLPTAAIGESDALKVGQLVIAIGSPLGTYSNSVTSGIVSAKGRSITTDGNQSLTNLIQTDAAINPGNSGGPLLDADGNIVGINTAIASNSNGIGFAIPIDIARPIMDQAVAGEKLTRPYLGISFVSITRQVADQEKLPVKAGALVGGRDANGNAIPDAVKPGTPAAAAGIKDGDIIVSVNGKAIDEGHPLDAVLAQFSPGDTVSLDVLRDGQHVTLQVTLGTRPSGL